MTGNPPNTTDRDALRFAIDVAKWQDSLLQSYRQTNLGLQTALVAVQFTGTAAVINAANDKRRLAAYIIVLTAWGLGAVIWSYMRPVLVEQGRNVKYWHAKIISAEVGLLPPEKVMTEFRYWRKIQRGLLSLLLSPSERKKEAAKRALDGLEQLKSSNEATEYLRYPTTPTAVDTTMAGDTTTLACDRPLPDVDEGGMPMFNDGSVSVRGLADILSEDGVGPRPERLDVALPRLLGVLRSIGVAGSTLAVGPALFRLLSAL